MIKNIITSAVVALVVALLAVGLVGGKSTKSFIAGGVTNLDTLGLTGLKIGSGCNDGNATCTGTSLSHVLVTTGDVMRADATQAPTTTAPYDITVSNALVTDNVIASFASTTFNTASTLGTTAKGWQIMSAHASSTAGFVTLMIYNGTGFTQALSATPQLGSSTVVYLFK